MVSKIIRTLLPTYAIRVSSIQEMGVVVNNNVTRDSLIGRLISFEINNFDNSVLPKIESTFKYSLRISKSSHKHTMRKDSESESEEEDVDKIEALMARRMKRGKGKYKDKLPLVCFNCKEIRHFSARCPNMRKDDRSNDRSFEKNLDRGDNRDYISNWQSERRDTQDYKDKGKKVSYLATCKDENTDTESDEDIKIAFVAVKDDSNEDEERYVETTLISKVSKKWWLDHR